VDPATADVQRAHNAVKLEPAEAQTAVGVLERDQPLGRPCLEHERLDLADARLSGSLDLLPHLIQTGVGMVDVRLLRLELGMHGGRVC